MAKEMQKEIQDVNESRFNPARAAAASAAAARILVVEDEAALSMLLAYNLEAEGFTVDRIERGDEAEIRLSESIPDLVILDWMLPGVSGLEICRRMRARETTRTLPVIMLTARGEESERVRGLAIGADDYVVKPFSVPELMAHFTRCCAERGRITRAACFGGRSRSRPAAARCTWGRPSSACSTI
jgi:two-component system phosphate regulon response regulator PhoB